MTLRDMETGLGSTIRVLATERICLPPPQPPFEVQALPHLNKLRLADVLHSGSDVGISLLVGADFLPLFLTGDIVMGPPGSVLGVGTLFGYVLNGPVPAMEAKGSGNLLLTQSSISELNDSVRRFWDLESLGVVDDSVDTDEHLLALEDFCRNVRFVGDRYEVALPWKENHPPLLCNYSSALPRFERLQKKLQNDSVLQAAYSDSIDEFVREEYVENSPNPTVSSSVFYLPHRPVVKTDSTTYKVRPVFDAGARGPNGTSLNDCLYTGPSLLPQVMDILLKFRLRKFPYTSDIRRAFLQIGVREADRDVLRFLWKKDGSVSDLRFQRLPFGVVSCPFLLQAVILHHLCTFPDDRLAEEMKESFYMDNFFGSADSAEEAVTKSGHACSIMEKAGMQLREWTSSSVEVREEWERDGSLSLSSSKSTSPLLGLTWNLSDDSLSLSEVTTLGEVSTKRQLLGIVSGIYDPLGFLGGYTLQGKILVQMMWKSAINWDASLPEEITKLVKIFLSEIPLIPTLKIPRWYFKISHTSSSSFSLHLFCDASGKGYGCCVYLRTVNGNSIGVSFVVSKNRVAPLKEISLPRLELMACLLGSRLLTCVRRIFPSVDVFCWTDSRIALSYIRGKPDRWKLFVCNRVREIQRLTQCSSWSHCPTEENPADLSSRGKSLRQMLSSKIWFEGPEWLRQDPTFWPEEQTVSLVIPDQNVEKSPGVALTVTASLPTSLVLSLASSCCSWVKALRRLAMVLRFISNIRSSQSGKVRVPGKVIPTRTELQ